MQATDALREMISASGLTQRQIATRMGRYDAYIAQALARPRIAADTLATISKACGYRLTLTPTDGAADPICIGDDDAPIGTDEADRIATARAYLARAAALLEEADAT